MSEKDRYVKIQQPNIQNFWIHLKRQQHFIALTAIKYCCLFKWTFYATKDIKLGFRACKENKGYTFLNVNPLKSTIVSFRIHVIYVMVYINGSDRLHSKYKEYSKMN